MARALEYLQGSGVECIKLDATPAGRPLYEQFGFQVEMSLTRWTREPAAEVPDGLSPVPLTRELEEADWPAVEALDTAAFGVCRGRLLHSLVTTSRRILVSPVQGPISGWGLLREGARADYVGPLEGENPEEIRALVMGLMGHCGDRATTWDIPDGNQAARQIAESLGFRPIRPLTRMRLGPQLSPRAPHTLFGITGPAVG